MSFGFSVGDFVTLSQLAWKVYKSCKDAPESFNNISQEVLSLSAVLREAEETFSGQALSAGTRDGLETVGDGCRSVPKDLQSLLDQYESLGTQSKRTGDRLGWYSEDIAELRSRLTSNTGLLTAFISTSQVAVAEKLNRFLREFQDGKRQGSSVTNRTVESLSIDEKETWRTIRKELEEIGITVDALEINKAFIMDWFRNAIDTGAFEEKEFNDVSSDKAHEDQLNQFLEASGYPGINQSTTQASPSLKVTQKASVQRARVPRALRLAAVLLRYDNACIKCAKEGREVELKLLLEKGADIESKDSLSGQTPLSWAAREGHEDVVKLLLEKGAYRESWDSADQTPLSWAARVGRETVVKLLLEKGAYVESKDSSGQTPVSWAAREGHEIVVKLLLEKGAAIGSTDSRGRTPLLWAARGGHGIVVKLLLEKGASIESKDSRGQTPLIHAAKHGHEDVVKLLLAEGANIYPEDLSHRTPLIWAAREGHEIVVKLLLEKGASEDSRDQTPLIHAAKHGHEDVVKLLLENGAYIESRDLSGQTPLSLAAEKGNEAVVQLLIENGADVNSRDDRGNTPRHLAGNRGHLRVLKLLDSKPRRRIRRPRSRIGGLSSFSI